MPCGADRRPHAASYYHGLWFDGREGHAIHPTLQLQVTDGLHLPFGFNTVAVGDGRWLVAMGRRWLWNVILRPTPAHA